MAEPIKIDKTKSSAARRLVECFGLYEALQGKLLALEGDMAQMIGSGAQTVMDQFGTNDLVEAQALADRTSGVCAVLKAKWGEPAYVAAVSEFFDSMQY